MSRYSLLVAGLAALVLSAHAQAAIQVDLTVPIGQRPSYSIEQVQAEGGIIVGDKLFDEFRVTTTTQGGGLAPNAAGIAVTGIQVSGELGLIFNGGWTAGAGQIADTTIGFRVSVVEPFLSQGFLITDNTLFSTAMNATNGGIASVIETVYPMDPLVFPPNVNNPLAFKDIVFDSNNNTIKLFDHKEFGGAFAEVWVVKDVIVNGSVNQGGQAHISEFVQTFSQIPEPSSLALVAGGVLLLIRRRRK